VKRLMKMHPAETTISVQSFWSIASHCWISDRICHCNGNRGRRFSKWMFGIDVEAMNWNDVDMTRLWIEQSDSPFRTCSQLQTAGDELSACHQEWINMLSSHRHSFKSITRSSRSPGTRFLLAPFSFSEKCLGVRVDQRVKFYFDKP
jgi:hypothetical protein